MPAAYSRLLRLARVFSVLLPAALAVAQTVLPIPNGGFEEGLTGWTVRSGEGMTTVSPTQAASGKAALKIVDTDTTKGSDATSSRVAINGAGVYELRGRFFPVSGAGLGIYLHVLDKDGKLLGPGDEFLRGLGGSDRKWLPFSVTAYTPNEARFLDVWIHSYGAAKVEAFLDDLAFYRVSEGTPKPPWPGQYKLRPDDKDRLTPADVVGPDGIVYPNWTQCGVRGGIPEVKPFGRIEDYGGAADDGKDDAAALDRACRAAGAAGRGAVVFGAGVYHLDRPVTIRQDGVVVRGQGMGRTRLVFRYALPPSGVAFYTPPAAGRVGRRTPIELHALPTGLQTMTIKVDDTAVLTWKRSQHSGNTFNCATTGAAIVGKVPDGPHTLRAVAEYEDGTKRTAELPILVDATYTEDREFAVSTAAIAFQGTGYAGPRLRLTRDGRRGDLELQLERVEGLAPGDCLLIDAPATDAWKRLTHNACRWGTYRRYATVVAKVDGNTVSLAQPLRIDFPVADAAWAQKLVPVQRGGVEDFTLEQTENLWITSVLFSQAWNCWARGVKTVKCGRNPVYGSLAKWCEIRNCVFDDAWFKGGGGTAYAGWEHSYDCLMQDCEVFRLRHGPLFQWSASGNVIRKCVFHESDGQWHSGWTNENLFEQCVIESTTKKNGGYGFGLWASPPEDDAHGPNGPRNVVYNCDVRSLRDGLWMGGMNENWLILYNRFTVDKGPGVSAKTASFDHILRGNVFVLKDGKSPMVALRTPDCTGIELLDNRLYGGNGQIAAGAATPARNERNQALPLAAAPRPTPAVPSIYEWENARERGGGDSGIR